jgi:WD40 repeat protein/serine/threonine protein kinase/tetratricopeptide (TPR) repeat protein
MSDSSADRNPVEELAEDFLARFRRGERPALSEYTSRFPDLATEIRDLFPALVMLEDVRPPANGGSANSNTLPPAGGKKLERLGDYRILREVGRGGMGIVYEAEQESLGRHVALKMLPAQSLLDDRHLQRFQREARAAARLHHTNIVPVFGVGEQEGLHYYVMQFIQGQGLDQVLAVLQRLRKVPDAGAVEPSPASNGMASAAAVAHSLMTGVFALPKVDRPVTDDTSKTIESPSSSGSVAPEQPAQRLTDDGQPYWNSVARIGIQVADALAYAHAQGTLHRDIKPSNLLLDTQGIVWVTDFGLAKGSDSEDLTHTGDVVGTLRYMAPERFKGKADPRSDVYALGLTLYELLTLRPAFEGSERNRLFLQVMSLDPPRPRKLNRAVPRDLETIVLKAVARDPGHRYQSAAEMAEDLHRFTDDKPIRARPVSELEKAWRWCRRNPSLAMLSLALLLTLALGIAGIAWKWREAEQQRGKAETETIKVVQAERETAGKRDEAIKAQTETRRTLASVTLDKGIALALQGEMEVGLFWMLEALKVVPEDDVELLRIIRTNLTAWRALTPNLRHVIEQPHAVGNVLFFPDGSRFLAQTGLETSVWDTVTGRQVGVPVKKGFLKALAPDGKTLLALEDNPSKWNVIHRCDSTSGARIGPPVVDSHTIRAASFSPDGKQVVTLDAAGILCAWDPESGKPVKTILKTGTAVNMGYAWSPDGRKLAIVGDRFEQPRTVRLWDAVNGARVGEPSTHPAAINRVVFSPDGARFLTASDDGTAQLWDAGTGKHIASPMKHPCNVLVAQFSPDGRMIVTGGNDGGVRWWDSRGYQLIGALPLSRMPVHDLVFSPDGKTLLVGSGWGNETGAIHSIEITGGLSRLVAKEKTAILHSLPLPFPTHGWQLHFASYSPDAGRILVGGGHGRAKLFDTATARPTFFGPGKHSGPFRHYWEAVGATTYSGDGRLFATASLDARGPSEVRLHDAETGQMVGEPLLHTNYVSAMAFSPDGTMLATGDYDRFVHFWDTRTGKRIGQRMLQPDIVLALKFRPDGNVLAIGHAKDYSGQRGVVLLDVASGQAVGKPIPEYGDILVFSPDGTKLVTSQWLRLCLWDSTTGERIGEPSYQSANIGSFAFRRDGKMILVGCSDGTLQLCDGETGKRTGAAMVHPAGVQAVAFSPDPEGKLLLAGYADGSARLWDRATQKLLGPPVLQSNSIRAVAFTPDGRSFVTSGTDGTTRCWPVPVPTEESLDRLTLQLQVRTGLEMNEGQGMVRLLPDEWRRRREQLARDEGSPNAFAHGFVSDRDYHDARARDAEQDGDAFAARWHLDLLLALHSTDEDRWLALVRRARQYTVSGNLDEAAKDYSRARKLGSAEQLQNWYRYRILECLERKRSQSAIWYVNRVLAESPNDWHVYADRATANEQLGRSKEWEADVQQAVARGADLNYVFMLVDEFARKEMWTQAGSMIVFANSRVRLPDPAWHQLALALVKTGNRIEYRKLCRLLSKQLDERSDPDVARLAASVAVVAPRALDDYSTTIALVERALKNVEAERRQQFLDASGALLFRSGRHRESIARLRESLAVPGGHGREHDWLFLAMALHCDGQTNEAIKYLDLARQQTLPGKDRPWEKLEIQLLREEAEKLVKRAH